MSQGDSPTLAPENIVKLKVNGTEYAGWKSVRIEPGIEQQARSFELSVTDTWPGKSDLPRRVRPGDACQVWIGPDLVLTGYIDATPISYDGHSVTVGVKGRSKTADLVDCCPIEPAQSKVAAVAGGQWADVIGPNGKSGKPVAAAAKSAAQWRNQKLEAIAAALAAPYGINVYAEVDTGRVIPEHQIQQGETVFESIDRMMRLRHVLSTDNERGDLVFINVGSAGTATTALELGQNILSGSASLDYTGVFSEYIVKGQRAGSDEQFAMDVAEQEGVSYEPAQSQTVDTGRSSDARATRRRVLVIKQFGQSDSGTSQDRADYERAYRAAKALQTVYTVYGWRQADGSLWRPNLLVTVRDGMIGFHQQMLIAQVRWLLDKEGMRTEITVGPPDGYRTKAGRLKAAKSLKGGGPDWSDVR